MEQLERRKTENVFRVSLFIYHGKYFRYSDCSIPTIMNGDTDTVRNLVEAQIQTTTTDSSNDTEETISAEANRSRLDGSQPDSPPIEGTGIPSELTNANPAPQARLVEWKY